MPGKRYGVHGCSNIADLNTGVSLHSSPVLKAAKYLSCLCKLNRIDFAILCLCLCRLCYAYRTSVNHKTILRVDIVATNVAWESVKANFLVFSRCHFNLRAFVI